MYTLLADIVVVFHLCFIAFALFGGLLVPRRRWVAALHLPAVSWVGINQFLGWRCPVTVLEKWLRVKGGGPSYRGGFIDHYLMPLIGRTTSPSISLPIVLFIIALFVGYYWYVFCIYGKPKKRQPN